MSLIMLSWSTNGARKLLKIIQSKFQICKYNYSKCLNLIIYKQLKLINWKLKYKGCKGN
jgi:hypothetical protein